MLDSLFEKADDTESNFPLRLFILILSLELAIPHSKFSMAASLNSSSKVSLEDHQRRHLGPLGLLLSFILVVVVDLFNILIIISIKVDFRYYNNGIARRYKVAREQNLNWANIFNFE
jgi:hypothetical protein